MKELKWILWTVLFVTLVSTTSNGMPLSEKALLKDAAAATMEPIATTTDLAPTLTKEERKAARKMKRMEKRIAKYLPLGDEDSGRTAAIVAYVTIFGFLISLLALHEKGNSFSAFHLRQALGLALVFIGGGIVLSLIPILGWVLLPFWTLFCLITWILGLVGAVNGSTKPIFLFGKAYQKWFKGIS